MSIKAVIFGCQDLSLSAEEKEFFQETQPLGFILFKRNCESPAQVISLITELKNCVNHQNVPILIDQEGGRVARLVPPHWDDIPPASSFYKNGDDLDVAGQKVYSNGLKIAHTLKSLGITTNCAPCADLLFDDADPIIGDRAFSSDPKIVSHLTIQMMQGLYDGGIIPIIKHIPGHGRAPVDSHLELPFVRNLYKEFEQTDFVPFQKLFNYIKDKQIPAWAMTAHIVFTSLDPDNPATHSKMILQKLLRKSWGFKGTLISDCLSMKALQGDYFERAQKAFAAGCDVALLCQGTLDEYSLVAKAAPDLFASKF